jgi:hypothetical protein
VLSADKPWQAPSAAPLAGGITFTDWRAAQRLLATALNARLVATTNSGHNVYAYAPQLVTGAIREVVESVQAGQPPSR